MKEGDQFYQLVKKMRYAQKLYFKVRSDEHLKRAKRLEREVDAWVDGQQEMPFSWWNITRQASSGS